MHWSVIRAQIIAQFPIARTAAATTCVFYTRENYVVGGNNIVMILFY